MKSLSHSMTSYIETNNSNTSMTSIETFENIAIIEYEDGSKYQGHFFQNKKNGFGKMTYSNGATFEGIFKNDLFHGRGAYNCSELKYEGYWKNGYTHGEGKEIWSNGEVYEGQFFNGQKHGFGVYKWPNGTVYRGYWENDQMSKKYQFESDLGIKLPNQSVN